MADCPTFRRELPPIRFHKWSVCCTEARFDGLLYLMKREAEIHVMDAEDLLPSGSPLHVFRSTKNVEHEMTSYIFKK